MLLSSLTLMEYSGIFHTLSRIDLYPHQHHISDFKSVSDLLPEVSKFQHRTKLCSKCGIAVVTALNLRPIWWWKESFFFYVWVSVHHKSILYKESTRCNFGSIVY